MSTMTLTQVVNQVKAMEGNSGTDDSGVESGIKNAINEGLDNLYEDIPWAWASTRATITANGDGNLVLPEESTHVLGVYDENGKPLNPRSEQKQLDKSEEITSRDIKTYAFSGYDSTTGFPLLTLWPAGSGSYTVRYQAAPTVLTLGADLIPGPRGVAHYLVWYARWYRLVANEERINLRQEAMLTAEQSKARLVRNNRKFLNSLDNYIGVMGT